MQTLEERAELKLTRITLLNPYSALLVRLTGGALGMEFRHHNVAVFAAVVRELENRNISLASGWAR